MSHIIPEAINRVTFRYNTPDLFKNNFVCFKVNENTKNIKITLLDPHSKREIYWSVSTSYYCALNDNFIAEEEHISEVNEVKYYFILYNATEFVATFGYMSMSHENVSLFSVQFIPERDKLAIDIQCSSIPCDVELIYYENNAIYIEKRDELFTPFENKF